MNKKPYLALFTSVVSVSFAAIFIVSVSDSVSSISIAFYRLLFTVLLISPFVLLNRYRRKEILELPRSDLYFMCFIGLILAAHFALWITSLKYTSVASSVLLVTAHPIFVGPIAHYFLKEKLSWINTTGIAISFFGVILLVYGNYGFTSLGLQNLEGNILAILGGLAAGIYILGGRKLRTKGVSIYSYAFIVYLIGSIALFFVAISFNVSLTGISLKDFGIIFLMAVVAGILGHTLYNWSLEYIRASLASVALLGEPIGSSLLAYILPWLQQIPTVYTVIGGGFILFGIYLNTKK
ncbi:MAG: DMT family transporter [Candidatus Thermoplasmatota archaeon]